MQSILALIAKISWARLSTSDSIGLRIAIAAAMLLPTAALAEPPLPGNHQELQPILAAIDSETKAQLAQGHSEALPEVFPRAGLAPEAPAEQALVLRDELEAPSTTLAAEAIALEAALDSAPELEEAELKEDEPEVEEATDSASSNNETASPESLTSNFFIKPQVDFSRTILDWQETVTGKPKAILEMGEAGIIPETGIVLSGAYWASQMYEYSNTAGKFPILSRFPSQHDNTSKSGEQFIINNAALGITGRLGDWGTLYLQPEYTEIEFPGQEEWQWRKAFVMVGNLDKFPLYAYYGRNTVDFGWMDGYNPFTHSVNNHFYRVDSDEAVLGVGYAKDGLHVIGTAIPSGRHLRVADTNNSDGWDNFSVNASYEIPLSQAADLTIGGGYLHSTIYNRVIAHHPGPTFAQALGNGDEPVRNGAYDLFAELQWEDLRAGIEYTSSLKKWPATDAKVQALTVQGAYDFDIGDVPLTLSAVYGLGLQGPDDEEYERLSQLAIGIEADIADYVTFAFEYVRNDGFVPLVAIARASDRDVTTNTYIFGMKLRF